VRRVPGVAYLIGTVRMIPAGEERYAASSERRRVRRERDAVGYGADGRAVRRSRAPEPAARLWFAVLLRDGFALAAAGGNEPFARLADGALRVVLAGTSLDRSADEAVGHVLLGFAGLGVHPDVPEGVRILRRHGLRLVTLTNGSADVADGLQAQAGLRGEFERLLSVEDAATWKPAPAAYAHAARVSRPPLRASAW
jgi:2-haloalkanoic acid dehalogenase type II